jgi:uncharacterized protein (DUF2267 family)
MSTTGLKVFDQTLQKTNIWLKENMGQVGPDRQRAYHAMRAVLHTLRDRLTVEEAAHLSAQLPLLIRGIYFEGWHPAHKPTKERAQVGFLEQVEARLQGVEPINPETATRVVLEVLDRHVDPAVADHVRHMLPKAIRELWPARAAALLRRHPHCPAARPGHCERRAGQEP